MLCLVTESMNYHMSLAIMLALRDLHLDPLERLHRRVDHTLNLYGNLPRYYRHLCGYTMELVVLI